VIFSQKHEKLFPFVELLVVVLLWVNLLCCVVREVSAKEDICT
jgi:hypothetical protein